MTEETARYLSSYLKENAEYFTVSAIYKIPVDILEDNLKNLIMKFFEEFP